MAGRRLLICEGPEDKAFFHWLIQSRALPDFRIFQLTPRDGRFVIGFGAAYQISGDNLSQLTHITGS